jgi:hypothetical protein
MELLVHCQKDFLNYLFCFRGIPYETDGLMKNLATMLSEQGVKRRDIARLYTPHELLLGTLRVRTTLGGLLVRHHALLLQLL